MGSMFEQMLHKRYVQMVYKHMERYLISLAIEEMQILHTHLPEHIKLQRLTTPMSLRQHCGDIK